VNASPSWPDLTLAEWADTRDTVHMWTQIVGKVKLALNPMVNHWWQVSLYVSARGLTTALMHAGRRDLELELDFVDHRLHVRTTDGADRSIALEPRSVASFYAETLAVLGELGVALHLNPVPNEVEVAIPFDRDEIHHAYDPAAAHRFWLGLVRMHEVLLDFRARFIGKHSPIHVFWGGFDLASTRFSGRPAPRHGGGVPHCPDYVQELAYSHEVSSCGYWPGGADEGAFYSYAYPSPDGFADWPVEPSGARYDAVLGEFLLPYTAVRTSPDPSGTLLTFLQSTYDAAATRADWDRAALEVPPLQWPARP
jgi:hypothetical protein